MIWTLTSRAERHSGYRGTRFCSASGIVVIELKSVIIRPTAAEEIDEAYLWYESQRAGLGEAFLSVVNRELERIGEVPELYAVLRRETRRAMLSRFPYSLLYRVVGDDVIVVACFHGKRDPRQWHERT